jgi:pyruvate,orthophosphate dikinase
VLKAMVDKSVGETCGKNARPIPKYKFGTMIELPRACLVADKLANYSDYFSFGTNDLTQTTMGISRDDCKPVISAYKEQGIIAVDPFVSLDQEGVGALIRIAILGAKKSNPSILLGVCGEHGGDVASIKFFCDNGLDYVSCSPYRIPIARLAAAQFYVKQKTLNQSC